MSRFLSEHRRGLAASGELENEGAISAVQKAACLEHIDGGTGDDPAAAYAGALECCRNVLAKMALTAVEALHGAAVIVEITAIGATSRSSVFGKLGDTRDRQRLLEFVARGQGRWNLCFGLQPRNAGHGRVAKAEDVAGHALVGLDLDHKHEAHGDVTKWMEARLTWLTSLDPALILNTGGGLQAFIQVERTDDPAEMQTRARALSPLLVEHGSDAVADLPRVMRLPFSINVLSESKRAKGRTLALAVPLFSRKVPTARPFADVLKLLGSNVVDKVAQAGPKAAARADLAPDIGWVSDALSRLPNDGAYDDDKIWIDFAHAVHGASGGDADVRDAFIAWTELWPEATAGKAEQRYDSIKVAKTGWRAFVGLVGLASRDMAEELRKKAAACAFPDDIGAVVLGASPAGATINGRGASPGKITAESVFEMLLSRGGRPFRSKEGQLLFGFEGDVLDLANEDAVRNLLFRHGCRLSRMARGDLIDILRGAASSGRIEEAAIRIAVTGETIWIDVGGTSTDVISVTTQGWSLVSRADAPVKFLRPTGSLALAPPIAATGRFDTEVGVHLNLPPVQSPNDPGDPGVQALASLVMALAGATFPVGGIPILIVDGPNGSGKSTFADRVKSLIDPSGHGRGVPPRNVDDVTLIARSQYFSIFDNLSEIRGDLSDVLCAISTGTASSRRTLYTTGGVSIFRAKRPLILTTINPSIAGRADLLDRAVKVTLVPITARQTERALNASWEAALPKLLGLWLNAAAKGLELLPSVVASVRPEDLPRQADAAQYAEAIARGLGWSAGTLLEATRLSKVDASNDVLDSDPFAVRVRLIVGRNRGRWQGSLAELGDEIRTTGHHLSMPQNFSFSAKAVSERINRLMGAIRHGWGIEIDKQVARGNRPSVVILQDMNASTKRGRVPAPPAR